MGEQAWLGLYFTPKSHNTFINSYLISGNFDLDQGVMGNLNCIKDV